MNIYFFTDGGATVLKERRRILADKWTWSLKKYHDMLNFFSGDLDENREIGEKVLKEAEKWKSRKLFFEDVRGVRGVKEVYWSIQGKDDRIVPLSLTMKSGEKLLLDNVDRKGNYIPVDLGLPLSYSVYPGDEWNEESWTVFTDEDIKRLPGYDEFARTHVDSFGCRHVSWNDVEHVIWKDTYSAVDAEEIFLKDGTRLSQLFTSVTKMMRFEDDGDRYVLHLNLDSYNFPFYKETHGENRLEAMKGGNFASEYYYGPYIPRLFTREYMEKMNYIPGIVKRTDDGRYVVSCSFSDLTEDSQKRFTSKGGKTDENGKIRMCLSNDILVGEAARHIEMAVIDGKKKLKEDFPIEERPDVKWYGIAMAGAHIADLDMSGARPELNFLEEGWKEKFSNWRYENDPFYGKQAELHMSLEDFPELVELMKKTEEENRKKERQSQGIEME